MNWLNQHWSGFQYYSENISDIQNINLTNKEIKIPKPETMMLSANPAARTKYQVLLRRLGVYSGGKCSWFSLRKNGTPILFVGPQKFNPSLVSSFAILSGN